MIEERNDALKNNNKGPVRRYEFAVKCLSGSSCQVVIDAACGMGYGAHILNNAGYFVIGFDKSLEAIEYAEKNYGCDLNRFIVRDIERDGIPNANTVVCLETLCHLEDPQKFIDGIRAKELIVSAPIDPNPNDGYFYRLHNLSEAGFKGMLGGWEIVSEFRQDKYLTIHAKKI